MLSQVIENRPREQRSQAREGLDRAIAGAPNASALREEFESLDTKWTPPDLTGFEPPGEDADATQ
jgi:hypothetical protein